MEAGFMVTINTPSTQLSVTVERIETSPPLTARTVKLQPLT